MANNRLTMAKTSTDPKKLVVCGLHGLNFSATLHQKFNKLRLSRAMISPNRIC